LIFYRFKFSLGQIINNFTLKKKSRIVFNYSQKPNHMKTKNALLALTMTGLLFGSCKKENTEKITLPSSSPETSISETKTAITPANLQTANFKIEGMTCAMGCAKTIEGKLTQSEGVQTAKVDFDKKMATVTFDKTIQNLEKISAVVAATGDGKTYSASEIK
jgi:periplasmic mercuric ion binding protein